MSSRIQREERVFQTEVKLLSQILWDPSLAPSILTEVSKPDQQPVLEDREKAVRLLHDKVEVDNSLPMNGPPRSWVREYGVTS